MDIVAWVAGGIGLAGAALWALSVEKRLIALEVKAEFLKGKKDGNS